MRKQFALIACIAFGSAVCAFAQEAVFSEINGKVEYQKPGADWKPAKVGVSIPKGTMVSTGFKSSASLKLLTSTIILKPLTRLSLEDLIKTQGGTQTKLYLLSGRVKADVPPQAGQTTDFRVKSPTATASVRGTSFEFDGVNLLGERGVIELRAATGQYRLVSAGEFSYIVRGGTVALPAAAMVESGLDRVAELVEQSTADSLSGNVGTPTEATRSSTPTGSLSITVQ